MAESPSGDGFDYLKYQNRRAEYLAVILPVVNWDYISVRYEAR